MHLLAHPTCHHLLGHLYVRQRRYTQIILTCILKTIYIRFLLVLHLQHTHPPLRINLSILFYGLSMMRTRTRSCKCPILHPVHLLLGVRTIALTHRIPHLFDRTKQIKHLRSQTNCGSKIRTLLPRSIHLQLRRLYPPSQSQDRITALRLVALSKPRSLLQTI